MVTIIGIGKCFLTRESLWGLQSGGRGPANSGMGFVRREICCESRGGSNFLPQLCELILVINHQKVGLL